ncbi:MAG: glycyl aminopeptidase [Haloarculaceae archaeon]
MRHGLRGATVVALLVILLAVGAGQGAADSGGAGPASVTAEDTTGNATAVAGERNTTTAKADTTRPALRAATGESDASGAATRQTVRSVADENIEVTQEVRLTPDRPGSVRVVHAYTIPDRVVSMATYVPDNATVVGYSGFDRANETRFEWQEGAASPTITYRLPVNRTLDASGGPESADGNYVYVDAGEWALFVRPNAATEWEYVGSDRVGFDRQMTTVGPGATGEWLVYLGENEIVRREAYDQTFELVVPARAELAEPESTILDAMTNASNALRVGDRDDRVFVIAAPTGDVSWAVRGLATGDADVWVRDFERLDTAENVWLHEYVHTRQGYRLTRETRWFEEASASYYAALLALERGYVEFPAFKRRLAAGEDAVYNETVLADPSTWQRNTQYDKGALVAGDLDRRIRLKTDRQSAFQDVFTGMNGQGEPITQEQFLALLERHGGTELRERGRNYTATTAGPEMWNATEHGTAFGKLPARIGYTLPEFTDEAGYSVSGPYREQPIESGNPIRLVTDERLTVGVRVRNAGQTEGRYNTTLKVNGTIVNRELGRIDGGTNRTVPLSHTFSTPGRFRISVDNENVTVVVERPARAYVSDLRVSRATVPRHGTVTAIATVRNDADRPASTVVVFTRDFEAVERQEAFLPSNSTVAVSAGIQLNESGEVLIGAGQADPVPVTVTRGSVVTPGNRSTPTPSTTVTETVTPGGTGAGFGAIAWLSALAVVILGGRYADRQ